MILMMSLVGLEVGGMPGAFASGLATFRPPCLVYYTAYCLWDRFRDMPWQLIVRRGLAPLAPLKCLAEHGCEAEAELGEADAIVRAYQDSPDPAAMLATLAQLRRKL
jgi:hypothetical protein